MAVKSLAVKYRPNSFDDVTEQGAIKVILEQQLKTGTTKNAYLFCGGAGTGKTTCARIFANEINKHTGNPIEIDAASNNSVDNVREIIQQSKTKSLDSEYKVFILDEVHMLSTGAWNALLKVLEEPPAKSVFIMCTTDPQKIPKTILSRVQRYDFQRISQEGICRRLELIYQTEAVDNNWKCDYGYKDAMEYIAKIASGGMRDAITMLDKCLAYSNDFTLENVVKALGATDYNTMFDLTYAIVSDNKHCVIDIIETVYNSGKDLKLFIRSYVDFILDLCKFDITKSFDYINIPKFYDIDACCDLFAQNKVSINDLLELVLELNNEIKWDGNPKTLIIAKFMLF